MNTPFPPFNPSKINARQFISAGTPIQGQPFRPHCGSAPVNPFPPSKKRNFPCRLRLRPVGKSPGETVLRQKCSAKGRARQFCRNSVPSGVPHEKPPFPKKENAGRQGGGFKPLPPLKAERVNRSERANLRGECKEADGGMKRGSKERGRKRRVKSEGRRRWGPNGGFSNTKKPQRKLRLRYFEWCRREDSNLHGETPTRP